MTLCKFEPCPNKGKGGGRGFCHSCGTKYRRGTLPGWEIPEEERCVAPDCKYLGHKEGQHCFKHYTEWVRNGKDPNYWKGKQTYNTKHIKFETECKVDGCEKEVAGNGFCISDWRHWKHGRLEGFDKNGDPIATQSHSH